MIKSTENKGGFYFSHTENDEKAVDTLSRRQNAVSVSQVEFASQLPKGLWERFSGQCCGAGNEASGFFMSTYKGDECLFVEAGNIDRVFMNL
tara:strand:+ start:135 stop:410 length:276 start_codon:yes stop_codon:yes gene_type:complete